MLAVHVANHHLKILQVRYLAKFMVPKMISFAICYITFNTGISLKRHIKRGAHMLAP